MRDGLADVPDANFPPEDRPAARARGKIAPGSHRRRRAAARWYGRSHRVYRGGAAARAPARAGKDAPWRPPAWGAARSSIRPRAGNSLRGRRSGASGELRRRRGGPAARRGAPPGGRHRPRFPRVPERPTGRGNWCHSRFGSSRPPDAGRPIPDPPATPGAAPGKGFWTPCPDRGCRRSGPAL